MSRHVNTSMLGKHVWELIHQPDKLWVRLLSSKYLSRSDLFDNASCLGASYTWRSICKAASLLKDGYITRIGRGDVSLWYEKWLHMGRLSDHLPYVDIHDIDLKVADIYSNGSWNFDIPYTQIPQHLKDMIQAVFINPNYRDSLIWESSPTGTYTTKSGYLWLTQSSDQPDGLVLHNSSHVTHWSWIWNRLIPENVKFFAWMVLHKSLPTNLFRHQRHTTDDPSCHRCGAGNESILHALRDCPSSSIIWSLFSFNSKPGFLDDDLLTWFTSFAKGTSHQLFLTSCWHIWKSRNDEVFNDIKNPSWKLRNIINSDFQTLQAVMAPSNKIPQSRLVAWTPPPDDFVKLNTDGSSFGNPGRSGFGGVIRNSNGGWLIGFSGSCGVTTNINAELLAIIKGLLLTWENGYRKVICESDCQTALTLIIDGVPHTHPYAHLISYIHDIKNYNWSISFVHTLREGNQIADWLAKHGASSTSDTTLWHVCPSDLSMTLLADAMGMQRSRE